MTVTVCFARARDLVGADRIRARSAEPATVGDLRRRLAARVSGAGAGLLEKSAFAVNDEFAEDACRSRRTPRWPCCRRSAAGRIDVAACMAASGSLTRRLEMNETHDPPDAPTPSTTTP